MTDDRHAAVKELFLAACGKTGAERVRLLDDACEGDPEMRREIESLLAHHDDAQTAPSPSSPDRTTTLASRPAPSALDTFPAFEAGEVFAGRYRLVAELGRGGMGQVMRAHDLVLDEPVALKFLPRGSGRRHLESLLNEVRLARQVTHPNVCRVFDFGDAEGEVYLTMELVRGEDLASLLRRIGRLPEDKLTELAHELCAALDAAHRKGVLHRDLKPGNVLIDGDGRVRVTDFGIAVTQEAARGAPLVGTPAYLAPEQWSGGEASVRSDLYALGLVLYEMATGKPAFQATTPGEYAALHQGSAPTPPSERLAHLDPRLEAVILRCLAKDPAERPASAREVAALLPGGDPLERALGAGETPSPELVARAGRAAEAMPAGRTAALALLLALLLAAVLVLGDLAFPGRVAWADKPPEALASRAGEILADLGHALEPADRAWGFRPDFEAAPGSEKYLFWYRQSEDWMVPSSPGLAIDEAQVTYYDPPPLDPGMVQMLLDDAGRLVTLKVLLVGFDGEPLDAEPLEGEPSGDASGTVDWAPLLAAAGLADAELTPTEPTLVPPLYADRRASWTAKDPATGRLLALEAASLDGRAIYFDRRPAEEDDASEVGFFAGMWEVYLLLVGLLTLGLTVGVAVVARSNLRSHSGDLLGARRLAVFVAVAGLLRFLFAVDHVPIFDLELDLFLVALGRSLVEVLIAGLAYIALEPLVRRTWPRTLIAWTLLLRGRPAEPQVGRSLLVGTAAGVFWVLLTELDRLLSRALGLTTGGEIFLDWQLDTALTGRRLLAHFLTSAVDAVYWGLLGLFFLVVLRAVFKRRGWAVAAFVASSGLLETLEGFHPAVSWLTLGVGIAGTTAFLLVRFGLLTYVAALFAYYALLTVPLSLDVSSWYAETGLWTMLVVAVVGAYGTWAARAGRMFTVEGVLGG